MNLIYGGSFENSVQPSGMFTIKGTPIAVVRDTGDRDGYGGVYSVKITSNGSGNEGIRATLSNLKASTTYTVRARVKATTGDTAKIYTTGASSNLSITTTSTSWVSLYGTFTTDSTPTSVVLIIGSDNVTDIVWFDMLMVVEGLGAFVFTPQMIGFQDRALGHMWTITNFTVTITTRYEDTEVDDASNPFNPSGLSNVIFNDHYLEVPIDGKYLIHWNLGVQATSGMDILGGIMVNGVSTSIGMSSQHLTADEGGNVSASAILVLSAGDEVSLYLTNETDTTNIGVNHLNLTIVRM